MNNESHGNKAQELIDMLKFIYGPSDSLDKAIEAIRMLQLISDNAGRLDIGTMLVRDEWWCKEQAKQYLESL